MSTEELVYVSAKTAAEICERLTFDGEAKALLRDDLTPRQFLDALIANGRFPDAARLWAAALPKREAIWWASQCARQAYNGEPPPPAAAAFDAIQKWVVDPSDENRRAAFAAGEAADFGTPVGLVAMATFFSGDSLAPPDLPPVPPDEHLTASTAANVIILSAVLTQPESAEEKYRKFFALGVGVASGTNRWEEKKE
jgi:hypothetical protein